MGVEEKIAARRRLRKDFVTYAKECLRVRSKSGQVVPFVLNKAQLYIHSKIEEQRAKCGMVRAIILKGRQQGCSTYTEGRFYWRVTHRRGVKAFILTHEDSATQNLFEMGKRYHDLVPDEIRPVTGASNAKELYFPVLDSGYKVGTAGARATGRSQTIQYFHGSEVAFWPNADDHVAGVMQAIPIGEATEAILESTAFGQGNFFHRKWLSASSGTDDYIPIFVPWYWQDEYQIDPPHGFKADHGEEVYAAAYGLTERHLAWRRLKISEFGGGDQGASMFKREYPASPEEAFYSSTDDILVDPLLISAAMRREIEIQKGYLPIWGVDVARFGDDRSTLAKRQSNALLEPVKSWRGKDTQQLAHIIHKEWQDTPEGLRPSAICVDVLNMGAGVVDRLIEMELPVIGVNVGERALDSDRFDRRRDELWYAVKEWFEARQCRMVEDHALAAELCSPKYGYSGTGGKIRMEPKDATKERLLRSPDLADAFVLTFAASPVRASDQDRAVDRYARRARWRGGGASPWAS